MNLLRALFLLWQAKRAIRRLRLTLIKMQRNRPTGPEIPLRG